MAATFSDVLMNISGRVDPSYSETIEQLRRDTNSIQGWIKRAFDTTALFLFQGAINRIGNDIAGLIGRLNPLGGLLNGISGVLSSIGPEKSIETYGQIEQKMKALEMTAKNMGYSMLEVSASVAELRAQGIKAGEAIESMSQAMQSGLSPTQIRSLARAGQDLAQVSGGTSTETFQRMFTAVQTGEVMMLRSLGIVKTQDQIINAYAAATKRTYNEVRNNANLMKQAFLEGIITEAGKYAGAYEAAMDTVAKRTQSLDRLVNDLVNSVNQIFTPFMSGSLGVVENALDNLTGLFMVTKNQALETAAGLLSTSYGASVSSKNLKDLSTAMLLVASKSVGANEKLEAVKKTLAAPIAEGGAGMSPERITQLIDQINTGAIQIGDKTYASLLQAGKAFEPTAFTELLKKMSAIAGRGFEDFGKSLIKKIFGGTDESLEDWAKNFEARLPEMAAKVGKKIGEFVDLIVSSLTTLIFRLKEFFLSLVGGAQEMGRTMVETIVSGIDSGADLLASGLQTVTTKMGETFQGFVSGIGDELVRQINSTAPIFAKIDESATGLNMALVETIKKDLLSIPGIKQLSTGAGDSIQEWYDSVINTGKLNQEALQSLIPSMQPITYWMHNVAKASLDALKSEDFGELNFIGNFLTKLFSSSGAQQTPETLKAVEAVRNNLSQILAQIRETGTYSQQVYDEMISSVQAASPEVARYIELWIKQVEIKKAERQYQQENIELSKQSMELEISLRNFQRATADIPERYTRGRTRQLQSEIDALNVEKQRREQAHQEKALENQIITEQYQAQKALMEELSRAAAANASISLASYNSLKEGLKSPYDSADLEASFKKAANSLGESLQTALKPARLALLELVNFFVGAFGGKEAIVPMPKPDAKDFKTIEEYKQALADWEAAGGEEMNAPLEERYRQGKLFNDQIRELVETQMPLFMEQWNGIVSRLQELVRLVGEFATGLAGLKSDTAAAGPDERDSVYQGRRSAYNAGAGIRNFVTETGPKIVQWVVDVSAKFQEGAKAVWDFFVDENGQPRTDRILEIAVGFVLAGGALSFLGGIISGAGASIGGSLSSSILAALTSSLPAIGTWISAVAWPAIVGFFSSVLGNPVAMGAIIGTFAYELMHQFLDAPSLVDFPMMLSTIIKDKGFFGTLAEIGLALPGAIAHLFGIWWDTTRTVWTKIGEGIGIIWNDFWDAQKRFWGGVGQGILDVWLWVKDELIDNSIIPDMIDAIVGAFTSAVDAIMVPVDKIKEAVTGAFAALRDTVSDSISDVKEFLKDLGTSVSTVKTDLSSSLSSIKTSFSNAFAGITTAVTEFTSKTFSTGNITKFIEPIGSAIKSIGDAVTGGALSKGLKAFTDMVSDMMNLAKNWTPKIGSFFSDLTSGIGGAFQALADLLVNHSIVPDMVRDIGQQFELLPNLALGPTTEMNNVVTGALKGIDTKLADGGRAADLAPARGQKAAHRSAQITVNQNGWVFPAGLDNAQRDVLKELARSEAYTGVVAALQAAGSV